MVAAISSHKVMLMYPGHTSPLANFECSRRDVLAPFGILCSLHLIIVWFLQAIWLTEWYLQLPSFLAFYVFKGHTGCSNTSLRTLCFQFVLTWSLPSMCHIPVIQIMLLCYSSHTWFQEFSVINPSVLLQDLHHQRLWYDASYCCLCVQSSMSSPLHHLIVVWLCSFVSKHL